MGKNCTSDYTGVSRHGSDRMRQRIGFNKRAVERTAKIAYLKGITNKNISGSFRRYLDEVAAKEGNIQIRIHGNYVYLFGLNGVLVTVLEVPRQFRQVVKNLRRRRKNA